MNATWRARLLDLTAVVAVLLLTTPPLQASPPPWARTEMRQPCADFSTLRHPYFGDLHIHTRASADAYIFGTRVGPEDAYDFATGASIPLADDDEQQTRSAQLDRPLDFAAVTDHAEFFGEVALCSTPGSLVYDEDLCVELRQYELPEDRFTVTVDWLYPAGIPNPPASHEFCDLPGVDCDAAAVSVWQEMQAAAEAAYDRSSACAFTTFIAYENTDSPLGRHLHRNVIFRNEHVPGFAASRLETYAGGTPQGVWSAIETDCLGAGDGCDAVIIPHNSNLSGGNQFLDPADATEAQRRQDLETLVEIHQQKGNSECRFDRLAGRGLATEDELCTFEQDPVAHQGPDNVPVPSIDEYPRRNMVRNALKDGLALEDTLGVNPFQMGFIGSTDTHNATGGNTEEINWTGGEGNTDSSPARQIEHDMRTNPGGLAVVWAEENSRDALFAALRRRETYATSGTRPVIRFFAGRLRGVDCATADLVDLAYRDGTPMGGRLGAVSGRKSPRFVVTAAKDPGTAMHPGTDLQRIQIVKGWVDTSGESHEAVFDVAGDPANGATVDPVSCAPVGAGAAELCAVWEDPAFDPDERAFYYARVLENPTCRWSTLVCKGAGVDPFSPTCAAEAAAAGAAFADCCLTTANDPFMEPIIQERSWTSPIWYRPEDFARLKGAVRFGPVAGVDTLSLSVRIGRVPDSFDPDTQELSVTLRDDDTIYAVTIPAGTMQSTASGRRFFYRDPTGSLSGLRKARLRIRADGRAVLKLDTVALDLSAADRTDHFVEIEIAAGAYRANHTRLWQARGSRLRHAS